MKVVHTVALSRTQSPDFVALYRWERVQLRALSWVARLLYEEIVGLASFTTGELSTSYAQLLALLTPDQPPHGRQLPVPTTKQIRTALDELQAVDLIARNKAANELGAKLSLHVEPRKTAASRDANLGRVQGRVEKAKKFWKDNKLDRSINRPRAGSRAGGSEGSSITTPPPQISGNLSTGQGPTPPEPDTPPGGITLARGDQKNGPPRGPDSCPAQAGHAPRATPVQMAMQARMRNAASAPPGGQADAPREPDAPAPSSRIRRPRNTVLKVEGAESGKASAPAGSHTEAQDGP